MELTLLFTDWTSFIFIAFSLITLIQLYYYWGLFSKLAFFKKYEKEKSQQHPVSVIVCARDEAGNLAKNLPGLLVQQYPSTHEIIVVNHNSQDDTRYLLDEFKKTFKGLHAVNLEQEAIGIPGKKYPLSIGIKEAKYEILLLTDADCVPASENWLQLMQEGYDEGIEVVLGYGSYNKKPGLLNKLIRFETFHSGLQYLSYAAAGMPYMGVGRNLSYKKTLFFNNKGFSSINHLPGGDDDLFINKVATKNNTRIVIDPEAFTLSEPAKNFGNWFRQKTRHYSTARYYKGLHKFLLGMYNVSFFLFYPLFVATILLFDWRLALGVFALRFISQAIIFNKTMKKLQEQDLFSLWWFFDLWMFIYYCIFAPALWKRPNNHWT